jgi:hypothetical protein
MVLLFWEPETRIELVTYALREGHAPFDPVSSGQIALNYMPMIMAKGG